MHFSAGSGHHQFPSPEKGVWEGEFFGTVIAQVFRYGAARRLRSFFQMMTKWFQSTRLETRTKESNMYASVWVANPYA